MPCVYILKNKNGNFYIGSTINLEVRIKQHLSDYCKTTKRLGAYELVFHQNYENIKDARRIEYKLKQLKRKDYIANIIKDGFIKIKP